MKCNTCGKWSGAYAILPGQPTDHICRCATPPEQTKRVPLTLEQIHAIDVDTGIPWPIRLAFVRAIEAKLGITGEES